MLALNIATLYFLWFWQNIRVYAVSNFMLGSLGYIFQIRALGPVFALFQYLHWLSNSIIRKSLLFTKLRCACHVAWKKGLRNICKILVRIPDKEWPFWEMYILYIIYIIYWHVLYPVGLQPPWIYRTRNKLNWIELK